MSRKENQGAFNPGRRAAIRQIIEGGIGAATYIAVRPHLAAPLGTVGFGILNGIAAWQSSQASREILQGIDQTRFPSIMQGLWDLPVDDLYHQFKALDMAANFIKKHELPPELSMTSVYLQQGRDLLHPSSSYTEYDLVKSRDDQYFPMDSWNEVSFLPPHDHIIRIVQHYFPVAIPSASLTELSLNIDPQDPYLYCTREQIFEFFGSSITLPRWKSHTDTLDCHFQRPDGSKGLTMYGYSTRVQHYGGGVVQTIPGFSNTPEKNAIVFAAFDAEGRTSLPK